VATGGIGESQRRTDLKTKWRIKRDAQDKLHHRSSFVLPNPSCEMALAVDQTIIGSMCEI
jgi:hypothetical protein